MNKGNPELGKVLSYQHDVSAIIKTIADIEAAIEHHETIIRAAETVKNSELPRLMTRREDLLAEMVVKGIDEDELAELDRKITQERARLETFSVQSAGEISDAQQALLGLTRKLEEAKAEFERIAAQKESVLTSYLLAEGEAVGAEYIQLANQLVAKYSRILAMNELLMALKPAHIQPGHVYRSDVFKRNMDLSIPIFTGIQSTAGVGEKTTGEHAGSYRIRNHGDVFHRAIAQEIEGMAAVGVDWL